ncbi:Hypothetical protein FKW44_013427, partial [Caligus rogercresseyi]
MKIAVLSYNVNSNASDVVSLVDSRLKDTRSISYLIPPSHDTFISLVQQRLSHTSRGVVLMIRRTLTPCLIKADPLGNFISTDIIFNREITRVIGVYEPNMDFTKILPGNNNENVKYSYHRKN